MVMQSENGSLIATFQGGVGFIWVTKCHVSSKGQHPPCICRTGTLEFVLQLYYVRYLPVKLMLNHHQKLIYPWPYRADLPMRTVAQGCQAGRPNHTMSRRQT